jgi:hypothetical protein
MEISKIGTGYMILNSLQRLTVNGELDTVINCTNYISSRKSLENEVTRARWLGHTYVEQMTSTIAKTNIHKSRRYKKDRRTTHAPSPK